MASDRQLRRLHDFGSLPFHVGPRAEPSNGELPDRLPFALGIDDATGRLVQMPDATVEDALERAYRAGSQIGTPLAETGLGRRCLDDFLGFVLERSPALEGRGVLEIGSGDGALLRALDTRGADVVGVEPGARPGEGGLPVIAEPFRRELFDRRFDLIVHYGVLEHILDPVRFVRDQLALLAEGGLLVLAVPDCSTPIAQGDVSMLVHEHWSYFTAGSLRALAARAGARVVDVAPAGVGGALYTVWAQGDGDEGDVDEAAAGFVAKARANLERLREHLASHRAAGATLGVFCPGRFLNYQALLEAQVPELRYFDDDPTLEGCYYPPSTVAIESRQGLLVDPVARLLIASWTFGAAIAASLRAEPRLADTELATLADVLGA